MTDQPRDPWGLFTPVPDAPEYPAQEKYQAHLLEQYKLYVEMTDRVSTRRLTANSYFLSINSAILGFVGYISGKPGYGPYIWLVGLAGIVLSVLWFYIITSYRDLNTAKFHILGQVEARLPLSLYTAEWKLMGQGKDPKRYRPMSHIERVVPWVFVLLHLYVVVRSLVTGSGPHSSEPLMTTNTISEVVLWLNTGGLIVGVIGAILLAAFIKVFITTNPDGTQHWGRPEGISNDEWLARNRRLRRTQKYVIPAGYVGIVIGFGAQLVALWLPLWTGR